MTVAADSYARRRLLDLLGIERYVPRPVRGVSAPMLSRDDTRPIAAEALPATVGPCAIACDADAAQRYPVFVSHLARAIGVEVGAFTRRIDAAHTICFGATPPDGPATLAPPLAVLRASPPAKRAFWRTLRDLRRVLAGR
ncbi:MAG TPA: hypothetical protein VFO79_12005 [Xanthomonadales bacterium]|nr:hypothetical protein [Xanthomonadales bacterium]